jgi:hypothetical protein
MSGGVEVRDGGGGAGAALEDGGGGEREVFQQIIRPSNTSSTLPTHPATNPSVRFFFLNLHFIFFLNSNN